MTKKKPAEIVPANNNQELEIHTPQSMIMQAIEKGASVEALEKLFNLQERWEKNQAKKAFDLAMTSFQSEMPEVKKTRKIMNKDGQSVRSKFASLDDAQKTARDYLKKNGLSYKFDIKIDEKFLTATCIVKHSMGHIESSEFSVPIGSEQFMSDTQKFGARATFAKRYAFSDAFGITMDDDNDAQDTGRQGTVSADEIQTALEKLDNCTKDEDVVSLWRSFSKELTADKEIIAKTKEMRSLIKQAKENENENI